MQGALPIKSLIRLNFLLMLALSAINFVFLSINEYEIKTLLYTLMTALNIGLISFVNTGLLYYFVGKFKPGTRQFMWYRYTCSHIFSASVNLIIWPWFLSSDTWTFDLKWFAIFLLSSIIVNSLVIILQDFILLHYEKASADLEVSRLKAAHAEASNLLLKQQIHPHFLFNALNTLKALYRKDPKAGDTYIVHLANFLRASVYNHTAKLSTVEEEVKLFKDYLEMQKIRFGTALQVHVDIPVEVLKSYNIPSFSLQPLLENAIKHNELTEASPLIVAVSISDDRIVIYNNLQKKVVTESSTNNGLANLTERYRLLSGDEVMINEDEHAFWVSIKLLKNEYSNH